MNTHHASSTCVARILLAALSCVLGCADPAAVGLSALAPESTEPAQLPSGENELKQRVEATLAREKSRSVELQVHGAWQVLHGILAYQDEFMAPDPQREGQSISALAYILAGGRVRGWDLEPVVQGDYRGVRFVFDPQNQSGDGVGSKRGQGHYDQWFAVSAQCGLALEDTLQVGDQKFTMADALRQVQQDLPFNFDREYSWTLIGLTSYLPTTAQWRAADGRTWSISKLVGIEAQEELNSAACGGTHRLIGLSTALYRHRLQNGPEDENWRLAREVVQTAVEDTKALQNPDGSFSPHFLLQPGWTPDLAENLAATGHLVEFLSIALSPEELREPWVGKAVWNLCDTLDAAVGVPLECGGLYHALHGLALYHERAFPSGEPPRYLLPGPK